MKNIWISRPTTRAQLLVKNCQALGLNPLLFPALDINIIESPSLIHYFKKIREYQLSIFISADAAQTIATYSHLLKQHDNLPAAAIGKYTAVCIPPAYVLQTTPSNDIRDSQCLLNTLSLTPHGKIAVIGGENTAGRTPAPALCQALREKNMMVDEVVCYKQHAVDINEHLSVLGRDGGIDAAVCYSHETLLAMIGMCVAPKDWLFDLPLFVIHSNIQQKAERLGFKEIIVVNDTSYLAQTIKNYFSNTSL